MNYFRQNPGVRPIGIGEVLCRILDKVMVFVRETDVVKECGMEQLCSGLNGGIEGTVYGMNELFELKSSKGFGMLLVHAKNAFNTISKEAALWNVRVPWPRCSHSLFNTFQGYALFWNDDIPECLLSKEGVTEDPLSMVFYGLAVRPLIRFSSNTNQWVQS